MIPTPRYIVTTTHGEGGVAYSVIDTWQSVTEQPAVIHSWTTRSEPNAEYLAENFCQRHNAHPATERAVLRGMLP